MTQELCDSHECVVNFVTEDAHSGVMKLTEILTFIFCTHQHIIFRITYSFIRPSVYYLPRCTHHTAHNTNALIPVHIILRTQYLHRLVHLNVLHYITSQLNSTKCSMYVTVNWVSIGSGNSLSPFDTQPLPEIKLSCWQLEPWEWSSGEISIKKNDSRKCAWKCRLRNGSHII